jgi:hypothetical protein
MSPPLSTNHSATTRGTVPSKDWPLRCILEVSDCVQPNILQCNLLLYALLLYPPCCCRRCRRRCGVCVFSVLATPPMRGTANHSETTAVLGTSIRYQAALITLSLCHVTITVTQIYARAFAAFVGAGCTFFLLATRQCEVLPTKYCRGPVQRMFLSLLPCAASGEITTDAGLRTTCTRMDDPYIAEVLWYGQVYTYMYYRPFRAIAL